MDDGSMQFIISGAIALGSAIITALATFGVSWFTLSKTHKNQQMAEKRRKTESEKHELIMQMNKVLECEGRREILEVLNGGHGVLIHVQPYKEHMRPILFEKFHLLSSDMQNNIHEIDCLIDKEHVMNEETDDLEVKLRENYEKVIAYAKIKTKNNTSTDD